MIEERGAGQPRGVLDGVDRPAAVAGLEVVPVAGVWATELDDAGAVPPWRVAADVGEPPLIADAAAVREDLRHPRRGRAAQPGDDRFEIVARRAGRGQAPPR